MTTDEPIEAAVCVTPSATRAEECAVVLASNGIAHRLETTRAGWMVMVAAGDAERASRVLSSMTGRTATRRQVTPPRPPTAPPGSGE